MLLPCAPLDTLLLLRAPRPFIASLLLSILTLPGLVSTLLLDALLLLVLAPLPALLGALLLFVLILPLLLLARSCPRF
jgi:hypothetical protein